MTETKERWTLVRHSDWTVKGDPTFVNAVEATLIPTDRHALRIMAAGGYVLPHDEARQLCETENYPIGSDGKVPKVRGWFVTIARMKIYIPPKLDLGSLVT